LKAEIKNTLPD